MKDRVGKEVRKVCYLNGKKNYAVWKLVRYEGYKHAHGQDIRRRCKGE